MKGYYFHHMDVRSTRAHACQILNTVAAIPSLSMELVLPKYSDEIDFSVIVNNHDLPLMPSVVLLRNFGIQKSGLAAFVFFNFPCLLFLIQKKIKNEVDFVYFRSSYFLPVAILAFLLRIPFFYETHRRPMSLSEKSRDHIMSRFASGIVVISAYMREHYLQYKKKILVAHDAVSLKRFGVEIDQAGARIKSGFSADEKICVYAGTISKLKGVEYVLAAARMLPRVSFVLLGIISSEFTHAVLPSNVKILTRVEQKELPNILRIADVLLLPHPKGEYSQSPMKLFEYMATGVPIVASRLPSICEVLNDTNAVLVEPESDEALARGIEQVMSDPLTSRALAEKAYVDVRDHTWDKRGVAIADFIRQIMQSLNKNKISEK